jgi:hypothetical protein
MGRPYLLTRKGAAKMRRLSELLQRQLKRNERKNLLHEDVDQLLEIDPLFLAAWRNC